MRKFYLNCMVFLTLIITFFIRCEYEPDDIMYYEINKNIEPAQITICKLNLYSDTVFIKYGGMVSFWFYSENHKINTVSFYIDNNYCQTIYSSNGGFFFYSESCQPERDTFNLTIEVFTNAATGSMADIIGAEGYLFSQTWVIIRNDTIDLGSKIINMTHSQGKLCIEWEQYKSMNFYAYRLKKRIGEKTMTINSIYDVYNTLSFDENYVGEKAVYWIETTPVSTAILGQEEEIPNNTPQINIEKIDDKTIIFSWNKSIYSDNISKYKILMSYLEDQYNEIAILDIDNTTYVYDQVPFPLNLNFFLMVVPKQPHWGFNISMGLEYFSTQANCIAGNPSFKFSKLMTKNHNYLFFINENKLFKFDRATNTIIDSLSYHVNDEACYMSPNGKFIITLIDEYTVMIYNIENNSTEIKTSYEITGELTALSNNLAVSDNGIGIFSDNTNFHFYNLLNSTLICSFNPVGSCDLGGLEISSSGDYFIHKSYNNNSRLYKINDNSVSFLQGIETYYQIFRPDQPEMLVYQNVNYEIVTLNCETMIITNLLSSYYTNLINFDFNNDQFIHIFYNSIKIYNTQTGYFQWSYPINSYPFIADDFKLSDSLIYYSGCKITVN